jgi:hypothetical protein
VFEVRLIGELPIAFIGDILLAPVNKLPEFSELINNV